MADPTGAIVPGMEGLPDYRNADGTINEAAYRERIAVVERLLEAATGWEKKKFAAEREDLVKGYRNAIQLQRMRDRVSRYGTDVQARTALAELEQKQRQFDATHGLEISKLGLDYAKTATDYLSTPDRFFQSSDFLNMAGRVMAGQGGPAPYGATGTPTAKTEGDFAVLAGGGNPAAGSNVMAAAGAGGAGGDARVKALKSVIDAVPPSAGSGMDANDFAVLQAAKALYSTNLQPGTLERMRPGQRAIMGSAGRRLGYDVKDWEADYKRSLPGQGAVRRA